MASGLVDATSNLFLHLILKIWDRCKAKVVHQPSIATAFLGQPWFPPAVSPQEFKIWCNKGIWRFHDIMSYGKLLIKSQIEHKFETYIPWYEYQQVYSMYTSYFMKFHQKEDPSLFELLLVKDSSFNKGVISLLYKSLCGSTWATIPIFQWAWAKNCQRCVHPETWSSIWASSLASAKSQVVRLQQLKVVTRWYITPVVSS